MLTIAIVLSTTNLTRYHKKKHALPLVILKTFWNYQPSHQNLESEIDSWTFKVIELIQVKDIEVNVTLKVKNKAVKIKVKTKEVKVDTRAIFEHFQN